MAGFQPLRRRVDLFLDDADPTDDWMAQRNAWVAARDESEAAGRDVWNEATKTGTDASAATPDDLIQLGAQRLRNSAPPSDELIQPVEPDGPLQKSPSTRFTTARPGDSISKMLGTSDPRAIGRFLGLNGMDGSNTTGRAGQIYALPAGVEDGSPDEVAAGVRAMRTDNAKLTALQAARAQSAARQQPPLPQMAQLSSPRSVNDQRDSIDARKSAYWQAYRRGLLPGAVRGGEHAIEGLIDTAVFALRLENPILDRVLSPPGQAAPEQIANTGRAVATAVGHAIADPRAAWQNAKDFGRHLNDELNPWAPLPATTEAAAHRGRQVGENHGEIAFNAAAIPVGGEVGATLESMRFARGAGDVTKYLRAGHPREVAEILAKPYEGRGHHAWARSRKLPAALGGGPLPEWLSESRLNILMPRGIDFGQMYALHFKVDPHFYGAKLRGRGRGQGWSGKREGLTKLNQSDQTWNGIPGYTKGVATGAALDMGDDLNLLSGGGNPQ